MDQPGPDADRDVDPTGVRSRLSDADRDDLPTRVRPLAVPDRAPEVEPDPDARATAVIGSADDEPTAVRPAAASPWLVPAPSPAARTTAVDRAEDHADEHDEDPDGAPTTVLTLAHDGRRPRRKDWAWVEQWRAEQAAPAWGPGIVLGLFVALVVGVALIVLTSGVADSPVLAVILNLVIAAGMAPALWLCRSLPVLRFLAAGAAVGILLSWIWMLTTFT